MARWSRRRAAVIVACLALLLPAACSTTEPQAPAPPGGGDTATLPPDLVARIDGLAAGSFTDGITGAIVGIDDPARGRLVRAYGAADAAGAPMTPDMHVRIASVTKTFTANAVLDLVAQDRLALDARLAEFVPDIPNGETITIRDLLAMRGGVYDFTADQAWFARYLADPTLPGWTAQDVLAIVRAHAAEARPPNTQTQYSNSEYVLLGLVVERVTGRPVAETLQALAERLGLGETSYPTVDELPPPFSRGYLSAGAATPPPYRDVTVSNPAVGGAAGAMVSTVEDMVRYAPILATGSDLPPALAAQRPAWSPLTTSGVRLQYGLGVTQLGDWVGHDGSIAGYSVMVWYLPAQRATMVVAVNAADGNAVLAQALWGQIAEVAFPGSLTSWPS
jgi:D-alanyl-D-alanine carboxypeptidase